MRNYLITYRWYYPGYGTNKASRLICNAAGIAEAFQTLLSELDTEKKTFDSVDYVYSEEIKQ
jgi:hypothetical protein